LFHTEKQIKSSNTNNNLAKDNSPDCLTSSAAAPPQVQNIFQIEYVNRKSGLSSADRMQIASTSRDSGNAAPGNNVGLISYDDRPTKVGRKPKNLFLISDTTD